MKEALRIESTVIFEEECDKLLPIRFSSGGIWKKGSDYFLERRNYNDYLLLYTMDGKGYLFYEGREYDLVPGMVFLIDCRKYQIYRTEGEQWGFAFIHFRTDYLGAYVDALYDRHGAVFEHVDGRIMETVMETTIALFRNHHRAAQYQACGALMQMLGMLYASVENEDEKESVSSYTNQVLRLVDAKYHEKLSLDGIAKAIGRSKYYLAHQFKQDMGSSIYEYLTMYRIEKGKLLLQNTNLPVSEIAEQIGFPGVSNFIRTFSAYEELTPHQYRKQWK